MFVAELRRIQERHGYLPRVELEALAQRAGEPLHRLHEVITFFPHFRLEPPPAAEVKVCRDMACHLHGAGACFSAVQAVAEEFGVARGANGTERAAGTGPRRRVEVSGVSCLGRCDSAPAVLVALHQAGKPDDVRVLTGAGTADQAARLRALLGTHLVGGAIPTDPVDRSPLPWRIDPYAIRPGTEEPGFEPYAAVRRFAETIRQGNDAAGRKAAGDALVATLQTSDLRGMGGAGRPAFSKWGEVRDERARSEAAYVVCNGDESEPSTFKDRELLLRFPHLVVEGMLLGGLLIGARKGYVYIRHEYHDQAHAVDHEIERARGLNLLGTDVLGTGLEFDLEVFESPGGYVCGEQSALIEAIEEHRAEPRNRPPAIEANGLFGEPTLLNNVETFAWVPAIVLRGGEWYRDSGLRGTPWYIRRNKPGARGLRLFSLCGDLERPGVFEVPVGTTLGALIDLAGGIRGGLPLLAFAPSGPSGGFVPATLRPEDVPAKRRSNFPAGLEELDIRDVPLDKIEYDDLGMMLGAGLLVVADEPGRDILDLALNATRFFRNESCGKCVPCRVGSEKLVKLGERLAATPPPRDDDRQRLVALVAELQAVMEQTSICGLGTSASKPLTSMFEHDWKRPGAPLA